MTTPPGPHSTQPITLTARSPEDLLAAAPVVLGFWPSDSIVMLTFGCRHPFHARVDLPDDLLSMREVAESLVTPAAQHGARHVVLLVYTADAGLADAAWRALRAGFRSVGVEVLDAVQVGTGRWYPLRGDDRPARRRGVAYDVSAHSFLAEAILDGRVTHGSRAELASTIEPDPVAVGLVAAVVEAGVERGGEGDVGAEADEADAAVEGRWVRQVLEALLDDASASAPASLSTDHVVRLLVALRRPAVREVAWMLLTRERARAAVGVWSSVLRRTPPDLVAAPAALLAWSAWQHGNGALAWCAVDRCRAVDPGDSLAAIVADALTRAVPPASVWAGRAS